jgi:hypothetical protein
MRHWLLRLAILTVSPTVLVSTGPRAFGMDISTVVKTANALSFRIHSFHQGTGIKMPSLPNYCIEMGEAEFALKAVTRSANDALFGHSRGLALKLQSVANRLSDELDVEEAINEQSVYHPCETPVASGASAIDRASFVRRVRQRLPFCQTKADALRVTFAARRELMRDCLRMINY